MIHSSYYQWYEISHNDLTWMLAIYPACAENIHQNCLSKCDQSMLLISQLRGLVFDYKGKHVIRIHGVKKIWSRFMVITFEQVDIQVTQQITHFFLPMYDIHFISDTFVKYFHRGVRYSVYNTYYNVGTGTKICAIYFKRWSRIYR